MICETCNDKHDGLFGSGRFCSRGCANTRVHSIETKTKIGESLINKKRSSNYNLDKSKESFKLTIYKKLMSENFDSINWDRKRKRIIIEQQGKCNKCGVYEWCDKEITLEIDHKNGISDDDRRENLEGLCPNCHSITDTWRGRNKSSTNGNLKVDDETLLYALENTDTIRQALLLVGLSAKGNNYTRAKKLLEP